MLAYELKAHLKHLQLAGQTPDGELEWIGSDINFAAVEDEIEQYENL